MEPIILEPTDRIFKHYTYRISIIQSRHEDIRKLIQHEYY
jgi:hypothetical protein